MISRIVVGVLVLCAVVLVGLIAGPLAGQRVTGDQGPAPANADATKRLSERMDKELGGARQLIAKGAIAGGLVGLLRAREWETLVVASGGAEDRASRELSSLEQRLLLRDSKGLCDVLNSNTIDCGYRRVLARRLVALVEMEHETGQFPVSSAVPLPEEAQRTLQTLRAERKTLKESLKARETEGDERRAGIITRIVSTYFRESKCYAEVNDVANLYRVLQEGADFERSVGLGSMEDDSTITMTHGMMQHEMLMPGTWPDLGLPCGLLLVLHSGNVPLEGKRYFLERFRAHDAFMSGGNQGASGDAVKGHGSKDAGAPE